MCVIMSEKCSSKVLKICEKDHTNTQPDPACDKTTSLQDPSDDGKQRTQTCMLSVLFFCFFTINPRVRTARFQLAE